MKRQATWNKLKEQMSKKSNLSIDSIRNPSDVEAKNKHEVLKFRVEGEKRPKTIETELMSVTTSKYSNSSSILLLSDWKSAYEYRSEDYLNKDNKEYIPLLDRFLVSGITVNNTVYLKRDDCSVKEEVVDQSTILYSFPNVDVPFACDSIIIYGPDVINGYQDDDFFLGMITNVHNKNGTMYTWFHNGNPIRGEYFLSLLIVD